MEKENTAELRDRLSEALARKGWKAADLVEKTGVPKGAVSYYLAGKSKPKTDRLYIIAQALDVSEAWLLGYDVPMGRTDDQKKNDQLAKLIVKLRSDEGFYNTVVALSGLDENQYKGIEQLVLALKK
jgi:transcriptional regulator with XRE-family HTH domain